MMFSFIRIALLTLLPHIHLAHAQDQNLACKTFEINTPAKAEHILDSKPEIRWQGQPQQRYRVQVALVLPEGRVLDSIDTQVLGTQWAFGSPIPVPLAAIKVLISQNCDHYSVQDLNAEAPRFFYDARTQCAIEPATLVQTKNILKWGSPPNANGFAITLFNATTYTQGNLDMQRLDRIETTSPMLDLTSVIKSKLPENFKPDSSLVASVQARCGVVWSQPQALAITVLP